MSCVCLSGGFVAHTPMQATQSVLRKEIESNGWSSIGVFGQRVVSFRAGRGWQVVRKKAGCAACTKAGDAWVRSD